MVGRIMERIIQDVGNAWKKDMVTDFLSEFEQVVKTCQKEIAGVIVQNLSKT